MGLIQQSRFSTAATPLKKLRFVKLSKYHYTQILALAPYPFLTLDFLAALTGSSFQGLQKSFKELKREPFAFVKVSDYQLQNKPLFMTSPLAYGLTEKTITFLQSKGTPTHQGEFTGPFFHQLFSAQFRSSFDIAARHIPTLTIIPWTTLRTDPRVPKQTRESLRPNWIPIPKSVYHNHTSVNIIPDCYPFIVQNTSLQSPIFPFLGLEIDMGTETIKTKIRTKLAYYLYALKNNLHRELFGFPKAYIGFVTTSPTRAANIIDEIADMTEDTPALRQYILVKDAIAPNDFIDKPSPNGHAVTLPWQRAKLPPLYLHK